MSSHRQSTRSGPPVWGLGEVLIAPCHKNWHCYETDAFDLGLD
jgi:hypothetical protein